MPSASAYISSPVQRERMSALQAYMRRYKAWATRLEVEVKVDVASVADVEQQ